MDSLRYDHEKHNEATWWKDGSRPPSHNRELGSTLLGRSAIVLVCLIMHSSSRRTWAVSYPNLYPYFMVVLRFPFSSTFFTLLVLTFPCFHFGALSHFLGHIEWAAIDEVEDEKQKEQEG